MMKLMMTAASAALLLLSGAASANDSAQSMALAQKNACLSCHGVDKKIVGPAFKEVAKSTPVTNRERQAGCQGESRRQGRVGPDSDAAESGCQTGRCGEDR